MKNIALLIFIGFATSLSLSSCSNKMSVFSQNLYQENNWSDNELSRIQFYLSDDVVLRRSLEKGETVISSGRIKVINGQKVEEIIFQRGTPGVFLKRKKDNHFAISFEDGDRALIFGPNNSQDGKYALLAIKWEGRKGTIKYDDKKWKTYNDGHVAKLLIDLKKIRNISVQKRKVRGRKVEG